MDARSSSVITSIAGPAFTGLGLPSPLKIALTTESAELVLTIGVPVMWMLQQENLIRALVLECGEFVLKRPANQFMSRVAIAADKDFALAAVMDEAATDAGCALSLAQPRSGQLSPWHTQSQGKEREGEPARSNAEAQKISNRNFDELVVFGGIAAEETALLSDDGSRTQSLKWEAQDVDAIEAYLALILPSARSFHSACVANDVYVVFGCGNSAVDYSEPLNDIHLQAVAQGDFEIHSRFGHKMIHGPDNQIFVFGGSTSASGAPVAQSARGNQVLHLNAAAQEGARAKAEASAAPAPVMKPTAASAGLSAAERKAREAEMTAKRQKKESMRKQIVGPEWPAPEATPAPQPLVPPRAAAAAAPRRVRLQLLCPQWGRNIVFTCFESTNTLGELRSALRQDLVNGLSGMRDGRQQDVATAEAQEASIVFAEQDMQMTLADASLCPSGTLLVDAAPIKVPAQPEPVEEDPQPPQPYHPDEDSDGRHSDPDDGDSGDDDDYGGDDDDDDDAPPGSGSGTFAGGFGGGLGRGNMGGFGAAQWRFGPTGLGPAMPEQGSGQALGGGGGGTMPDGPGQTVGTASPEELRAAREDKPASSDAASAGLAPPAQESGRIKGQLGTGASKAARAKEREAILQQMEEDRQRYQERHVAPSAVAAQGEAKVTSLEFTDPNSVLPKSRRDAMICSVLWMSVFNLVLGSSATEWCRRGNNSCRGQWANLQEADWRLASYTGFDHTGERGIDYFYDWDKDGIPDIIHFEKSRGGAAVMRYFRHAGENNLNEQVGNSTPHGLKLASWDSWQFVDTADWKGDGRSGVLCCHKRSDGLEVLAWVDNLALQGGGLCGSQSGSEVLVAFGRSSGTTRCQVPSAVDWDHDGRLDLLLGSPDGRVRFLRRQADDTLEEQELLAELGSAVVSLQAVDWDGDGDLDLFVVTRYQIHLYERLSTGHLQLLAGAELPGQLRVSPTNGAWRRHSFADWDGDGLQDMISCAVGGFYRAWSKCTLWLRSKDWLGKLLPISNSAFSRMEAYRADNFFVLDWNGDDSLDLLMSADNSLHVYKRLNSGELDGMPTMMAQPCGRRDAFRLSFVKDWDGDGKPDLICVARNQSIAVAKQSTDLSFSELSIIVDLASLGVAEAWPDDTWRSYFRAAVTDVVDWNGDGLQDFLLTSGAVMLQTREVFKVLRGIVPGRSALDGSILKAADFNKDGLLDVVMVAEAKGQATIFLQLNGSLQEAQTLEFQPSGRRRIPPRAVQVVDWYGSGVPDVLIGDGFGNFHQGVHTLVGISVRMLSSSCVAKAACNYAGVCSDRTSLCRCDEGYISKGDCAACAKGYFTSGTLLQRQCLPCAGRWSGRSCYGRGTCFDDLSAQSPGSSDYRAGNGSCACNDARFYGTDERGLRSCHLGECGAWQQEVGGQCRPNLNYLMMLLLFAVQMFGMWMLLYLVVAGSPMAIEDISLDSGVVVVTTATSHRLLRRPVLQAKVHFSQTGHPLLDSKVFYAKPMHSQKNRCVLLEAEGHAMTRRADASIGWLMISRSRVALCVGFFMLPLGLLCVATGALALCLYIFAGLHNFHAACAVGVTFILAAAAQLWRRLLLRTSLNNQLDHFSAKVASVPPVACPRGADRGITTARLLELWQAFEVHIRDRDMYFVVANIVKPLTSTCKLSYVEYAGPAKFAWFVSHFWGTPFCHFKDALCHHTRWVGEKLECAYWICSFSNNQWAIQAELGSTCEESSFFLALNSLSCKGTAMVLDEEVKPLSRSWCLFEVLQTRLLKERRSDYRGLSLCTSSGVLGHGSGLDVVLAVGRHLTSLRLQDASASEPADKKMIDERVESMAGGFEATNEFVRVTIREALELAEASFQDDLSKVVAMLS
ncbi:hypothetical protein AK812_SmicGene17740 [Symbiodinium microadriaticum]|uniref:Uncharacterized protein n=1 Tax=Symbiodinium microadriaticum TaxID=2951 RepID=A0A1Q9DWY1_SYMMI|nr:hypothetical protein AK812_SmicGene17740 [Symbiodinium microadriaticum]